ncbi:MAG: hypothetical protein N2Z71_00215 [Caloramator sp.]|nr:hypothetical protein [Caloramator sp.]
MDISNLLSCCPTGQSPTTNTWAWFLILLIILGYGNQGYGCCSCRKCRRKNRCCNDFFGGDSLFALLILALIFLLSKSPCTTTTTTC